MVAGMTAGDLRDARVPLMKYADYPRIASEEPRVVRWPMRVASKRLASV